MSYSPTTWSTGDVITADKLNNIESGIVEVEAQAQENDKGVSDLKSALKSGDEEDAIYHLGFYLDENGDLCQVEEDTNNG